ncbi:hypothetical protein K488DRAFT_75234 [Vararia minispora EC-137]|uniref:Uncharacterized protein n=1 Tax=Vararia minispora EC-137 TaxID=1314806 RepID=A0ACB8Q494_9AGAM|nr:hypothetical protein K488DRAFT_75234 [Vararia minispora EC-137]
MSDRFYLKKKKPHAHSSTKNALTTGDGSPKHAAEPPHNGRPYSIKSKAQHDWLEKKRPEYEHASQKGKTAVGGFITETTTVFLNEFSWTGAHFRVGHHSEEEEGGGSKEVDPEETDTLYKMARQSPHYIPEMHAQLLKELTDALGEEDGASACDVEDESGDETDKDEAGDESKDELEDVAGDRVDGGGGGAARRHKKRQRLALEELLLSHLLETALVEVKVDVKEWASAEMMKTLSPLFEKLVAWLAERGAHSAWYVATPEDGAEDGITVYIFVGGASVHAGSSADAVRVMATYASTSTNMECEEYVPRLTRSLAKEFQAPSARTRAQTSEMSSPPAMRLADEGELDDVLDERDITTSGWPEGQPGNMASQMLVVPQCVEDESSVDGSNWYWPGEVREAANDSDGAGAGNDDCACAVEDGHTHGGEGNGACTDEGHSRHMDEIGGAHVDGDYKAHEANDYSAQEVDDYGARDDDDYGAWEDDDYGTRDDDGYGAGGDDDYSALEGNSAHAGESVGMHTDDNFGAHTEDFGVLTVETNASGMCMDEGDGVHMGESERLGDLMTQEELEYWDAVMWPDKNKVSPKDIWLQKVSKP